MFDGVPCYYVVNRSLRGEYVDAVMRALRIHPPHCSIISRIDDAPLALSLSREVIRASDDEHAQSIAFGIWKDTFRPTLVLGEAEFLDAVYEAGLRLEVVTRC
jgi:hypothetical protein